MNTINLETVVAERRVPVQKRSRERYERMLAAATDLIARNGSEGLKMSEVAAAAGVPIGSLYQFFPDKAAIVATLAERCNAESRRCIEEGLHGVATAAGLQAAFSRLLDDYYTIFLADPAMRDVWSAMQSDPALRAAQLRESRANAAVLKAALRTLRTGSDADALDASALVVMHLGEEAIRLAVSVPRDEGDRLFEVYKRMALIELAVLVG